MTWKRVGTAAALIPVAVGLVVWGSTALVSIAVALITLLALFDAGLLPLAARRLRVRAPSGIPRIVL